MEGVQVFVQRKLEHTATSLPANDRRPCQEQSPNPPPFLAIFLLDLLLMLGPVDVPLPERSAVVDTKHVDRADLKPSTLHLRDDPAKTAARIRTGEDVLVHEQAPDQIFKVPRLPEPSNLEEENTVIFEEVVNLLEESGVATNTDMLGHLEGSDLVVATRSATRGPAECVVRSSRVTVSDRVCEIRSLEIMEQQTSIPGVEPSSRGSGISR